MKQKCAWGMHRDNEFDDTELGSMKFVVESIEDVHGEDGRNVERLRYEFWICSRCAEHEEMMSISNLIECMEVTESLGMLRKSV